MIKSELTGSRVIEGGETLVIFFFFGKMSLFLPSGSHPDMKQKKRKKREKRHSAAP